MRRVEHLTVAPCSVAKPPTRVTLDSVNAALKAAGIDAKLFKGKGYWYFQGHDVELCNSTMVTVIRLQTLTLREWVLQAQQMKAETDRKRGK